MKSPSRPINLHHLTIALVILFGVLVHRNQCAPAVEDEDVEGGCYYMFNHYGEGDRILTNEPCLNCTCHNSMLMCYLRVCPFTKPIGQDCTIEKKPDQCCPVITCPQVPVSLVTPTAMVTTTSTTTAATVPSSEIALLERGCEMDGKYYADGAQVASDPNKPCELCYCIRNRTACVMQECILHVEGCKPVFESGVCCPVRYQCDAPLEIETTTPSLGNLISTTISNVLGAVSSTPQPGGCYRDGEYYADGSQIPSPGEDACNHCYCMRGDIVCAVQECGSPLENEGGNCTAVPPRAGLCCPEKYACHGSSRQDRKFNLTNESDANQILDDEGQTTEAVTQSATQPSHVSQDDQEEQTTAQDLVSQEPQGVEASSTLLPSSPVPAVTSSGQEEIRTTTESGESLNQEATTVHVHVALPDEKDQTTLPPAEESKVPQNDEGIQTGEGETVGSTELPSITSQPVIHEGSSTAHTSTGAPSSSSEVESGTTIRPDAVSQSDAAEKVDSVPSSSAAPEEVVTTQVPEKEQSSTHGTSAEMVLTTTTPEIGGHHDDQEPQQTTVPEIIVSSSTSSPSSQPQETTQENVEETTSAVSHDEAELPTTSHSIGQELSSPAPSHAPAETTSQRQSDEEEKTTSASVPQHDDEEDHSETTQGPEAGQTVVPVISSTDGSSSVQESQPSHTGQSIPTTIQPEGSTENIVGEGITERVGSISASSPTPGEVSSVSSTESATESSNHAEGSTENEIKPGVEVHATYEPSTAADEAAVGTTPIVDNVPDVQQTTFSPIISSAPPSQADESSQTTQEGQSVSSTSSPVTPSHPVTTDIPLSISSEKEAVTHIPGEIVPETTVLPSEVPAVHDQAQVSTEEPVSSEIPSKETSDTEVEATTPGIVHDEAESHTSPAALESSSPSSVETAASSVATERIITTTHGSVEEIEGSTIHPTESSPAESSSQSPTSSSAPPAGSDQQSSAPAPTTAEPQEESGTVLPPAHDDVDERVPEIVASSSTLKPTFEVSSTEGHMVIIPEQANNNQIIPVMPQTKDNQTESASPAEAASPSVTEVPASTSSTSPQPESPASEKVDVAPQGPAEQATTRTTVVTPEPSQASSSVAPSIGQDQASHEDSSVGVPETTPSQSVAPVHDESVTEISSHEEKLTTPEAGSSTVRPSSSPETVVQDEAAHTEVPSPGSKESGTTLPTVDHSASSAESSSGVDNEIAATSVASDEPVTTSAKPVDQSAVSSESSGSPSGFGTTESVSHDDSEHRETTNAVDILGTTVTKDQEESSSQSTSSASMSSSASTSSPSSEESEATTIKSVETSSEGQSSTENSVETSSPASDDVSTEEHQEVGPTTVKSTSDAPNDVSSSSGSDETSSATTESDEAISSSPPRIPGEGSCFVEGVTYRNGSRIPPSTPCQVACACQNSIVHCLLFHCAPAPMSEQGACKPVYKPGICCPEYDCEASSSAPSVTVTPETPEEATVVGGVVTVTSRPVAAAEDKVSNVTSETSSSEQSTTGTVAENVATEESTHENITSAKPEEGSTSSSSTSPSPSEPSHEIVADHPEDLPENTLPPHEQSSEASPTQMPVIGSQESGKPQTTEEVVATTPESGILASSTQTATSVDSHTEISLVSSSSSSSSVSSTSSSSEVVNGNGTAGGQPQSEPPILAGNSTSAPTIDEKVGQANASFSDVPAASTTTSPESLSTSASPVTPSENEIIPTAANDSSTTSSSSAGPQYPVTTTTTVTSSPATWPYPTSSSSTTAPSMSSGACLFDGRVYMSAQQIPRDDPCDFCFCFRGDIICLQQSCPPPIPGCYEEPIPGFCCPRYECPVGTGNSTTTPPMYPPSYYHGQIMGSGSSDNKVLAPSSMVSGPGCEIQGEYYETGQVIVATSGPCLECRCGSTGMMECDPRECQPEPMLRKMIAAISSR